MFVREELNFPPLGVYYSCPLLGNYMIPQETCGIFYSLKPNSFLTYSGKQPLNPPDLHGHIFTDHSIMTPHISGPLL